MYDWLVCFMRGGNRLETIVKGETAAIAIAIALTHLERTYSDFRKHYTLTGCHVVGGPAAELARRPWRHR